MPNDRFRIWLRKVDAKVQDTVGLSVRDLADQPFADWFADGVSPAAAARRTLANEGFDG